MKPYPTTIITNHAFISVALRTLAKTYSIGNTNAAAGPGASIAKGGYAAAHAYGQACAVASAVHTELHASRAFERAQGVDGKL